MSAQTEAVVVGMVTTQILEGVPRQTHEDLRLVETWMVRDRWSLGRFLFLIEVGEAVVI